MRRLITILFFCCFFILMSQIDAEENQNFTTLKKGTLTVGTYFTNPPFEFIKDGKRVGFEVDLVEAICKRLKLKCVFVDTVWEGIIDRLQKNSYDVIVGGITITANRAKLISFSLPYMNTTLSIIIDEKLNPKIQSENDLKGSVVGVQAETTDQDVALQLLHDGKISKIMVYPFADFNLAINDLQKGVIQAAFKVFPVAYYLCQHTPGLKIAAQIAHDPQPLGFGFNLQNESLLNAFNQVLKDIQEDGTFQSIYNRWFGS